MEITPCSFSCPVEATIQLIGGKYKAVILWHLMDKTLRYNELHKLKYYLLYGTSIKC